jgi:hypothetical protein
VARSPRGALVPNDPSLRPGFPETNFPLVKHLRAPTRSLTELLPDRLFLHLLLRLQRLHLLGLLQVLLLPQLLKGPNEV